MLCALVCIEYKSNLEGKKINVKTVACKLRSIINVIHANIEFGKTISLPRDLELIYGSQIVSTLVFTAFKFQPAAKPYQSYEINFCWINSDLNNFPGWCSTILVYNIHRVSESNILSSFREFNVHYQPLKTNANWIVTFILWCVHNYSIFCTEINADLLIGKFVICLLFWQLTILIWNNELYFSWRTFESLYIIMVFITNHLLVVTQNTVIIKASIVKTIILIWQPYYNARSFGMCNNILI